jgi:hypothetical protein
MKTVLFIGVLGIIYYLTSWVENIEDQTSLKIAGLGKFKQQDLLFVSKVVNSAHVDHVIPLHRDQSF